MDLPRFDGTNALQWIFQSKQFFDYYDISYAYRVKVATIHFDGPVVPWFQMLQKSGATSSWNILAKAIENSYGPSVPLYSLFKLFQECFVSYYYSIFTTLANRAEGFLDCFICGLWHELQHDVIPWQLDSIIKAFTLARLFEENMHL